MSVAPAKRRIEFIDLAKGICILLVVLNHSGFNPYPFSLLRLPLYFILSGLFFKDYGGYLVTIIKKINKLIVPCLFFYIISVAISSAICAAAGVPIRINITDIFTQKEFHNAYLWFLFSLFWTNIAFLMLKRNLKRDRYIFLFIVGLVFIGIFMVNNNLELPLFMDSVFFTLPYFFFGYILHKSKFLSVRETNLKSISFFLLLLAVILVGSFAFGRQGIDMRLGIISGNPVIVYITAISFVCALLMITKRIVHLPVISFAGRYSLIILGLHYPVQYIFMLIYKNLGIDPTPLLYFIPMAGVPILLIPLLIKYAPRFTAQKDLIPCSFAVKSAAATTKDIG